MMIGAGSVKIVASRIAAAQRCTVRLSSIRHFNNNNSNSGNNYVQKASYDYQQPRFNRKSSQEQLPYEEEVSEEQQEEPRASFKKPVLKQYSAPATSSDAPPSMTFYSKKSDLPISPFPEELQQTYSNGGDLVTRSGEYAFSERIVQILTQPIDETDVEIKPDGIIYLPEVRYRKILIKAFGPGGWCLVPRGPHTLSGPTLSREYALYCEGRFISQTRGSASITAFNNPALASESARSNALMRCCKDLGIADELWDPLFVARWKKQYAIKRTVNDSSGRPKILWSKRDNTMTDSD